MNTKLRKHASNNFEKEFFKLMNNKVYKKTMENEAKNTDIKLLMTETRRNYLVLKPNYHTTKKCSNNILATEMKRTQILINKPVYLGLSIVKISKRVMYEFFMIVLSRKNKIMLHRYRQLYNSHRKIRH